MTYYFIGLAGGLVCGALLAFAWIRRPRLRPATYLEWATTQQMVDELVSRDVPFILVEFGGEYYRSHINGMNDVAAAGVLREAARLIVEELE